MKRKKRDEGEERQEIIVIVKMGGG
jgi:hypothetical protein